MVIESASSKITILNGGILLELEEDTTCWAKCLILSRTTAMPLSSEAFNSKIRDRHISPNKSLDAARIVEVFPVPEIKQNHMFFLIKNLGKNPLSCNFLNHN